MLFKQNCMSIYYCFEIPRNINVSLTMIRSCITLEAMSSLTKPASQYLMQSSSTWQSGNILTETSPVQSFTVCTHNALQTKCGPAATTHIPIRTYRHICFAVSFNIYISNYLSHLLYCVIHIHMQRKTWNLKKKKIIAHNCALVQIFTAWSEKHINWTLRFSQFRYVNWVRWWWWWWVGAW